jgi:hypothetical protein
MPGALLQIVKRALARALVHLQIVEEIVHDLTIVEADLRQPPTADLDDFMDVAFLTGVGVIDLAVVWIGRRGTRGDFRSSQGGLMAVLAQGTSVQTDKLAA